jgi:hypothetical protein
MPNQFVYERLAGIQHVLIGVHRSGAPMSAASRGDERQAFVGSFLANVLPTTFRFGSGDATDEHGHRSGQLDVVIEYPFSPSLPSFGSAANTRLYLAESVAAVVEVKSNVAAQWDEAKRTAAKLAPLRRAFEGGMMMFGDGPSDRISLFVAGYTGWNTLETLKRNLDECPDIAGVLVIDRGLFVSSAEFGGVQATGPWALWGLISCLHRITNSLQAASTDPQSYAM